MRGRFAATCATFLAAAMLSGCAAQPAADEPAGPSRENKETASQLYAGQPAVVHATEYPVASAAEGIQRGDEAWRQGKLDLAVYLYVQSLAFDSASAAPFLKIGTIHEQLGNRALAEKAYELALERQPQNAAAAERLGLLYLQSGKNEQARAAFESAIALEPNRWRSHNGLGIVADRRGDYLAAIAHYDRALAIDPKAAPVMNNRGYSRFLAGDLRGGEADLREAIRLGARDGAWTNLGRVQAKQGRYPEALESFSQDMDMAHAYNLLGECAMERRDYAQAKRYFESANSAAPRYFEEAQKNLSVVNERMASAPALGPAGMLESLFATEEASVYSNGVAVGVVRRGDRVEVLESKEGRSRISFRDADGGTARTGWVPSAVLAERLEP